MGLGFRPLHFAKSLSILAYFAASWSLSNGPQKTRSCSSNTDKTLNPKLAFAEGSTPKSWILQKLKLGSC